MREGGHPMRPVNQGNRTARSEPATSPALGTTASRKADHLRINLEKDVAAKGVGSGFDDYDFVHRALPELDLDQVNPGTTLFGRQLNAPLMISCMIGGTEEAGRLNRVLAETAQQLGLAMGLGSARPGYLQRPPGRARCAAFRQSRRCAAQQRLRRGLLPAPCGRGRRGRAHVAP